jgi:HEAT repeat protein
MGWFDRFKKTSASSTNAGKSDLSRFERLLSTKLSQEMDRQDAIHQLSRMGTAEAAAVLLKRFNWHMDPSITDQDEKELALEGIVAAGDAALEPIREYCRRAESLTWPIKALERIVSPDHLEEELLGLLDQFDTEYVRNPEPKTQLLASLALFPSDDVRMAVEPFLEDASESVRFCAVATVFSMSNPQSVPSLISALGQEESLRVKNRIAQGLAERQWQVTPELHSICETSLPPGFKLVGELVRADS